MKIDLNKKYKTRDGREVRIYATDGGDCYSVHGAYKNEKWIMGTWTLEGFYDKDGTKTDFDLIEVKEKKQLTGFLNVYEDGIRGNNLWPSKEDADMTALSHHTNRIACIDLSQYGIFYEENEGL